MTTFEAAAGQGDKIVELFNFALDNTLPCLIRQCHLFSSCQIFPFVNSLSSESLKRQNLCSKCQADMTQVRSKTENNNNQERAKTLQHVRDRTQRQSYKKKMDSPKMAVKKKEDLCSVTTSYFFYTAGALVPTDKYLVLQPLNSGLTLFHTFHNAIIPL